MKMYTNIHQSPFVGDLSHYQQYLERKEREEGIDKTNQKTKQGGVQSVKLAKQHQTFSVFKAPRCLERYFLSKKNLSIEALVTVIVCNTQTFIMLNCQYSTL